MKIEVEELSPEERYEASLKTIDELWDCEDGSAEYEQLMALVTWVETYEAEHYFVPPPSRWQMFLYRLRNHRYFWRRGPSLAERVEQLDDLVKIQCANGTWNYNEYHLGVANGLILAKSVMTGREPEFLEAPENGWLKDRPSSAGE